LDFGEARRGEGMVLLVEGGARIVVEFRCLAASGKSLIRPRRHHVGGRRPATSCSFESDAALARREQDMLLSDEGYAGGEHAVTNSSSSSFAGGRCAKTVEHISRASMSIEPGT
jgi:hypothetical protein